MTLTVRPELERRLAAVAGQLRRDPAALLEDALAAYVAHQERIIAGIQAGIEAAERGEGTPHDEVFSKLEKKLFDKYGIRV